MSPENTEIINKQLAWLKYLQTRTKKPILVKAIEGETPDNGNYRLYMWNYFMDVFAEVSKPIYTRASLPNEIFLDPDVKNWDVLKTEFNKIITYAKKESIPLQLAYSGGNGIHGDIFLNSIELEKDIIDNASKFDVDIRKIIRQVVTDIIFEESGANREALKIDSKKINYGFKSMGSMVREYGTTRDNGKRKTLIDEIPETREEAAKLPLRFPDKIDLWNVPEKYNSQINDRLREGVNRAIDANEFNMEQIDIRGADILKIPCIKKLMKGVTESRYYAACSIMLMAGKTGTTQTAANEILDKFFSKCDGLTGADIKIRKDNVQPLFKNPNYHFSCRVLKETFGELCCEFRDCPISKKASNVKATEKEKSKEDISPEIITRAEEILTNGDPVQFIMGIYNKIHVGDSVTGKVLLGAIGSQSVLNSAGIQPKLSGKSGKGKSHAVSSILHLMPQSDILESSLSDKAIYHSNLKPGTIIYSDDVEVSDELQGVIKRSTTNFQKETKHTITVKRDGEFTAMSLSIPQRILWALTSVNDNGSMEFLNRQFNLGVDESEAQDEAVMIKQLQQAANAEIEFPVNDEVLTCRAIFKLLREKTYKVSIPYAERIEWHDSSNRRNISQFLDLIKSFAVYNIRKRTTTQDGIIEATEDDFKTALSLYSVRAINQKLKLNDNEIRLLSKMKNGVGYDIKALQDLTGLSYTTIYKILKGRDGKTGLLEKVPALQYQPEMEFIGETTIEGSGSFEHESTHTKKTKPHEIYTLHEDFSNLGQYSQVATLKKVK